MNFHYSTDINKSTYFSETQNLFSNEDAHCDKEVNFILGKTNNQYSIEQSKKKIITPNKESVDINRTGQYYFIPIQEQNSIMAIAGNNVFDKSSILLSSDLDHPTTTNAFDDSMTNYLFSSRSTMSSSDINRGNDVNHNDTNFSHNLTDADLAELLVSSLDIKAESSTIPLLSKLSNGSNEKLNDNNKDISMNVLNDVFLIDANDLDCNSTSIVDKNENVGPPPGFENFMFNSTSDFILSTVTNTTPTISSMSNTPAIETQVSSDILNYSQLLQSTSFDTQNQQKASVGTVGNIRSSSSSSSSHSSFTSDEQSTFLPTLTHPYSPSSMNHAKSQILSTTTPSLFTIKATNTITKPSKPNSLSLNRNDNFPSSSSSSLSSLILNSTGDSPVIIENNQKLTDGELTPNHTYSFFNNGHADCIPLKPTLNNISNSSASSTSSIDDALVQLTQQQQMQNMSRLYNNDSTPIFDYSSLQSNQNTEKEHQAVHDNINFLALMATASTSSLTQDSTWQQQPTTPLDSSFNLKRNKRAINYSQTNDVSQTSIRNNFIKNHELMEMINEFCNKGFDELNSLIQELRWVQTYANVNATNPSLNSPSTKSIRTNNCSLSVFIVPEYFIFKCKKVEALATHVFELLANARIELRLHELVSSFKTWKEAISNAEKVYQEEENKFRLTIEHPQSFYMSEAVLRAGFERVSFVIRQLCSSAQQARVAFEHATLQIYHSSFRQQQQIQSQTSSPSTNSSFLAQLQLIQQQKSTPIQRSSGSMRSTFENKIIS